MSLFVWVCAEALQDELKSQTDPASATAARLMAEIKFYHIVLVGALTSIIVIQKRRFNGEAVKAKTK